MSIEASYPLSPLQRGIIFHSRYAARSGVCYVVQRICKLHEALDVAVFKRAWGDVTQRHAALRACFRLDGGDQYVQDVYRDVELQWREDDWRDLTSSEQQARLDFLLGADRERGFDLATAPLMRHALFRVADKEYWFVWTSHHALLDGRSVFLVFQEVFNTYDAVLRRQPIELATPPLFSEHVAFLHQQDLSAAQQYWQRKLDGFVAPTELNVQLGRPQREPMIADGAPRVEIELSEAITERLVDLAGQYELTLNTLLQGAWALVLSHYSGQEDVVFGATRACQQSSIEGADSIVGLLINTLPMRVSIRPDEGLIPWLRQIRSDWVELREFEQTPLDKIQEWSEVTAGTPLIESVMVFERTTQDRRLREQGGNWEHRRFDERQRQNYPVALAAYGGARLLLRVLYEPTRLGTSAAVALLAHLRTLLEEMAADPMRPVSQFPLMTAHDQQRVLEEWNATQTDYPQAATVHELFEEQVRRDPSALAVQFEQTRLTYGELNARANQLHTCRLIQTILSSAWPSCCEIRRRLCC